MSSFFEILQQFGQFYFLVIAASGANFILWRKAVFFQALPLVGFFCAIFMFINLSFDRLLAVAFPILYYFINYIFNVIQYLAIRILINVDTFMHTFLF